MQAHQNYLQVGQYLGSAHPRCECHECTQARARENQGGLASILKQSQAVQRNELACPHCGKYPKQNTPDTQGL